MFLVFASTRERRPSLLRGRSTSLFFLSLAARLQVLLILFSAFIYVLSRSSARSFISTPLFRCTFAPILSYSFPFSIRYSLLRLSTPTNHLSLPFFTVSAKPGGLNIYLENVPAGDDHVLFSLNSTHAVLQGLSQHFTILSSSGSPISAPIAPLDKATTVSVNSGPNPTAFFATTMTRVGGGGVWG
jgi:hypothetical protein